MVILMFAFKHVLHFNVFKCNLNNIMHGFETATFPDQMATPGNCWFWQTVQSIYTALLTFKLRVC